MGGTGWGEERVPRIVSFLMGLGGKGEGIP